MSDHFESPEHTEHWLSPAMQEQRRWSLGLKHAKTKRFIESNEFVSLGCYCAVSRALQALGLKKYSYPLDWTRSPASGIIHCLENRFSDFLTHKSFKDHGVSGQCFGNSDWGGSFWHHDPRSPTTKHDMERRVRRFFGDEEVAQSKARFFVRAVNSSQEVLESNQLLDALRKALPKCEIHLLVLIDYQLVTGPTLAGIEGVLFYKLDEALFSQNGANWKMQDQAEAYAKAIAFAARYWAGAADGIVQETTLSDLVTNLVPFHAGDPGFDMFWPKMPQRRAQSTNHTHMIFRQSSDRVRIAAQEANTRHDMSWVWEPNPNRCQVLVDDQFRPTSLSPIRRLRSMVQP